jgi:S1-C subfamily serine protease
VDEYPQPRWAPATPPPRRRRRLSHAGLVAALVLLVVGVVAEAGNLLASGLRLPAVGGSLGSSLVLPRPGGSQTVPPGVSSPAASPAFPEVVSGLVDINVTIGLQGERGAATGIVLTSDGVILTNNHVVDGATAMLVTDLGNGKSYDAVVLGYDRTHDVAVIKLVGASGLQTAPLGSSASLAMGDRVVAIGNAGGAGGVPSVAAGSVVALGRTITATDQNGGNAERLVGLIEVDADVVPGDSGGPLVDAGGKVVGMDTAASSDYSFDTVGGNGFAIPIDDALGIADQIRQGTASATVHIGATAFLGVSMTAAGQQGSVGAATGAFIADVLTGSPADKAGLASGDTVVFLDGSPVDSPAALIALIGQHRPGDTVTLAVVSPSGEQRSVTVTFTSGPPA